MQRIVQYLIFAIFFLLTNVEISAQPFIPATVDTTYLRAEWRSKSYSQSLAYHYLMQHYDKQAPKDSLVFLYPNDPEPCHFRQEFKRGITYQLMTCDEEGGGEEIIRFPKMELARARSFIESLFYDRWNAWLDDYHYHPDGAGCYYTIVQGDDFTEIQIWCGC